VRKKARAAGAGCSIARGGGEREEARALGEVA